MADKDKKVLIALTSHDTLGDTGRSTGYYLSEVTHPYIQLAERGIGVDIVSVRGGAAPMDPGSRDLDDPTTARFLGDPALAATLEHTLAPSQVDPDDYEAIIFAGGHGTMWDFPEATELLEKAAAIYERGGIVGAVCHGPAALTELRVGEGTYLVAGKHVAAFTNAEEEAVGLAGVVPFLLETRLRERGALHEAAPNFQEWVVVDGRLVTGQNPASATGVGKAVADMIGAMRLAASTGR